MDDVAVAGAFLDEPDTQQQSYLRVSARHGCRLGVHGVSNEQHSEPGAESCVVAVDALEARIIDDLVIDPCIGSVAHRLNLDDAKRGASSGLSTADASPPDSMTCSSTLRYPLYS